MESETTLYAQILKQMHLEGKIHLITFDRSEKMMELLEEGVVDAIIVQQSYKIGYESAKIAARLAKGEVPEEDTVYIGCSVISRRDLRFWIRGKMQMSKYYTVGIVEDELIERQALRMIMEEKRPVLQIAFEAGDGNSALEMAKQYRPDILIVDIQDPGVHRSGTLPETAGRKDTQG